MAVAALVVYFWASHPWWLILVLALAPDLAMAVYAAGLLGCAIAVPLRQRDLAERVRDVLVPYGSAIIGAAAWLRASRRQSR